MASRADLVLGNVAAGMGHGVFSAKAATRKRGQPDDGLSPSLRLPPPRRSIGLPQDPARLPLSRKLGGSGSDSSGWVTIPRAEYERVYAFRNENDLVYAVEQKLAAGVTGHGLTLKLLESDEEVRIDPDHQSWVQDELHEFAVRALIPLIASGTVVCGIADSTRYRGEKKPFVRPWSKYELGFVETSESGGRRYYVTLTDRRDAYSDMVVEGDLVVQDNENNRGYDMYGFDRLPLLPLLLSVFFCAGTPRRSGRR